MELPAFITLIHLYCCDQQVTAVTEEAHSNNNYYSAKLTLSPFNVQPALPHSKLLENSHIINQNVEQPDLVSEARGNVETCWVDGHTEYLLSEPLRDSLTLSISILLLDIIPWQAPCGKSCNSIF